MNNYLLKPIKYKDFNFICFSLNENRPDDYFQDLEEELKNMKKKVIVLLDLYKSNGEGSKRFFKIFFDGKKLDLKNIEKISKEELEKHIFNDCQYFYNTL